MVHHRRHVLKEPFVRAIAQPKNLVARLAALSKVAPSAGNDSSDSGLVDSLKYCLRHSRRIVQHDTPKSDVDRLSACFEKGGQVFWW